jgi:hypothetical protein
MQFFPLQFPLPVYIRADNLRAKIASAKYRYQYGVFQGKKVRIRNNFLKGSFVEPEPEPEPKEPQLCALAEPKPEPKGIPVPIAEPYSDTYSI